ncbi:hypothetical protein SAY87_022187 [Trapa incisa]|uniref:Uncharacterized protein n=1 Tax=Trapa incisa TaxID=236973 RepID=A0AAN7JUV8_9MYRT|nr:hypothetical protein SAY87_022187 [Trapa incisa]
MLMRFCSSAISQAILARNVYEEFLGLSFFLIYRISMCMDIWRMDAEMIGHGKFHQEESTISDDNDERLSRICGPHRIRHLLWKWKAMREEKQGPLETTQLSLGRVV